MYARTDDLLKCELYFISTGEDDFTGGVIAERCCVDKLHQVSSLYCKRRSHVVVYLSTHHFHIQFHFRFHDIAQTAWTFHTAPLRENFCHASDLIVLCAQYSFIREWYESRLYLSSQSWSSFTDPGGMKG